MNKLVICRIAIASVSPLKKLYFILPKGKRFADAREISSVNETDDEELSHCITRVFP